MILADRAALSFVATPEALEGALERMRSLLEAAGLEHKARFSADVVFEEVVTNIVRHGAREGSPPAVDVSLEVGGDRVVLVFMDDSFAFNPCERADPERYRSLGGATLGGLGISLVRKMSTGMSYERTPEGENRLTVILAAR